MTRIRYAMALVLGIAAAGEAPAQFVPILPLPAVGQGGIAFRAGGGNLRVAGFVPLGPPYPVVIPATPTPLGFRQVAPAFLPYGVTWGFPPIAPGFPFPGYGVINQRITVQVINPPGLGARVGLREVPDLSGIDLDVESPDKIWGRKPAVGVAAARIGGGEKVPEPKRPLAAAPAKPEAVPPPPKAEPIPDGARFAELGIAAFRRGEFGVAALRFRQAAESNPPGPRAPFLLGQAYLAIGKYREAADVLRTGLRKNPDWAASVFRPRVELYENRADLWKEHRDALLMAQMGEPKNGDYPFLLGYLAWFDGQRAEALAHFDRARLAGGDLGWHAAFLGVAKNNP